MGTSAWAGRFRYSIRRVRKRTPAGHVVSTLDIDTGTASDTDADGVRVQRTERPGGHWRRWGVPTVAIGSLIAGLVMVSRGDQEGTTVPAEPAGAVVVERDPRGTVTAVRSVRAVPTPVAVKPMRTLPIAEVSDPTDFTEPSRDPADLAAYFQPGDAEPTMAELIEALNDAGVHEGIAAFNPPGTSPVLGGIAVPTDFVLPPGYVRHHQVTDQGVDIEPILMFAPDVQFFDEEGRPIAIPEDRVVPPELVPPGLPIRPIDVPDP